MCISNFETDFKSRKPAELERTQNPQTERFARKRHRFEENSSSKRSGIGVLYAQIADFLCDCPLNPDDGPGQKKDGKSR
jgi:hypothetical protein